jgi:hypothetical protein
MGFNVNEEVSKTWKNIMELAKKYFEEVDFCEMKELLNSHIQNFLLKI